MKDKRGSKNDFKYKPDLPLILNHLERKRKIKRRNLDFETQVSDTSKLPMSSVLIITDLYIPQQMQGNLYEHISVETMNKLFHISSVCG